MRRAGRWAERGLAPLADAVGHPAALCTAPLLLAGDLEGQAAVRLISLVEPRGVEPLTS